MGERGRERKRKRESAEGVERERNKKRDIHSGLTNQRERQTRGGGILKGSHGHSAKVKERYRNEGRRTTDRRRRKKTRMGTMCTSELAGNPAGDAMATAAGSFLTLVPLFSTPDRELPSIGLRINPPVPPLLDFDPERRREMILQVYDRATIRWNFLRVSKRALLPFPCPVILTCTQQRWLDRFFYCIFVSFA